MFCIVGKLRKSGYMSNAGLFERMRFLWRKARVWQSWVRIWAEDTSCTGRQHRRYPHKSQALSPPCGRHLVHHRVQRSTLISPRPLVHRVEKLQTMDVSSHQKLMPRHVVRALQQKAGSLPTVSTSLAQRQENLRLGLSGFHLLCNLVFGEEEVFKIGVFWGGFKMGVFYRIRKQSFSRQGRGGEAPVDSGFW